VTSQTVATPLVHTSRSIKIIGGRWGNSCSMGGYLPSIISEFLHTASPSSFIILDRGAKGTVMSSLRVTGIVAYTVHVIESMLTMALP